MDDTISRQWLMECVEEGWIKFDTQEDENRFVHLVRDIAPPAQPGCEDAVPWEKLERYAEWFCAQVSYPEFIREAKAFCESTISGMKGGNIAPSVTPKQPGWIPVAERLPTENNSYRVWMPFAPEGHHITVAEWCGSYWNIKTPITAWMPLRNRGKGGQE